MGSVLTLFRVLPLVTQALVIALLFRRAAQRRYPWFTAYLITDYVLSNLLWLMLATAPAQKHLYVYGYIAYSVTAVVLAFAALFEVSRVVLRGYPSLRRLHKLIFGVYAFLPIGVAIVLALMGAHHEQDPLIASVLVLEIGMRLAQLLLVAFFLATSKLLNVHWRTEAIGIVLGFGLFAAVDLSLVSLRGRWGPSYQLWFDFFRGLAANAQLLVWLGYFWFPHTEATLGATERLHHWDDELRKAIGVEPLGPEPGGFRDLEAAVDRVLGSPDGEGNATRATVAGSPKGD